MENSIKSFLKNFPFLNIFMMSNGNIIAEDTEFTGDLICQHSVTIHGKVKGSIQSEKTVIVRTTANIEGNIKAAKVIIQGKVNGDVFAKSKIAIQENATVTGRLDAPAIDTDKNASVQTERIDKQETIEEPIVIDPEITGIIATSRPKVNSKTWF